MSETEISTYAVRDTVPDLRGGKRLLTGKQKKFLVALSETGDGDEAAKIAGYKNLSEALESEFVAAEAERIQVAWGFEVRMNARFTSGEHMRLMDKFETEYDGLKKDDKPKMAAVLAKMSDTSLKASGKMSAQGGDGGSTVNVQINIGGNSFAEAAALDGGE
jgi:hypothetical protein